MTEFKKGDVVQLKSGGPIMTVYDVSGNGHIGCEWFDKKDEHHDRTFAAESIEKYDPNDGFGIA